MGVVLVFYLDDIWVNWCSAVETLCLEYILVLKHLVGSKQLSLKGLT